MTAKQNSTLQAERGVVGLYIANPEQGRPEVGDLKDDELQDRDCKQLLSAIRRLEAQGKPIDALTVMEESKIPASILQGIIDAACTVGSCAYHAQQIKSAYLQRRASEILQSAPEGAEGLRFALQKIGELIPSQTKDGLNSSLLVNASHLLESIPNPPEYILEGVFEVMARVLLVGSSKTKKSFLAKQIALCVASGHDFCGIVTGKPRRVLLVNLELTPDWLHRRLLNMCKALQITKEELGDRLAIINGRGHGVNLEQIEKAAIKHKAELVILDPLYKLDGGADESDPSERKALIAELEAIGQRTGAALLYVHHDPKGTAGDRNIRDRGAGHSVINRDVDATLALTQWGNSKDPDAENLIVLSVLARNSPPRDDLTLIFDGGAFFHDPDREPVKATSKGTGRPMQGDPRADGKALAHWARTQGAATMTQLREKGNTDFGAARTNRALNYLKDHLSECAVSYALNEKTKQGYIGTVSKVGEIVTTKEGFKVL